MKRLLFLAIFISLSFITVQAQRPAIPPESGKWITIAPANAGFRVLMPAQPSVIVPPSSQPGVESHLLIVETKSAVYLVVYVQRPADVTDPATIRLMLDRRREAALAKSGGKLKSEKDITLDGFSGREWLMDLPDGTSVTARAYIVKRNDYMVAFSLPANGSDTPEAVKLRQDLAKKFFDSFSLISEPGN